MAEQVAGGTHHSLEELNQTELGRFFVRFKWPVLITLLLLVLGGIGLGIYKYQKEQQLNTIAESIYQFKTNHFEVFKDEKVSVDQLVSEYEALVQKLGVVKPLGLLAVELSDELMQQDLYSEALKVLAPFEKANFFDSYIMEHLIGQRLVTLYENLEQFEKAEGLILKLVQKDKVILEGKLHFDLARIYLLQGKETEAKAKFQYVKDNFKKNNFNHLAEIYLQKL